MAINIFWQKLEKPKTVLSLKVGVTKGVGQSWNTCFPGACDPHPLGVQVYWNKFQRLLGFAAAWLEGST